MRNRDLEIYDRFRGESARRILTMIDDEVIAEHAAGPTAHHSDRLIRILNFFRNAPMGGKYIILCTKPWSEFRIAVLSEQWTVPPVAETEGVTYPSEAAARHGIFLRRIEDLNQALSREPTPSN